MHIDKNFALILAGAMVAATTVGALTTKYGQNVDTSALLLEQKIPPDTKQQPHSVMPSNSQSCDIKGNISINSGEQIYHFPGQEFYNKTIILNRWSGCRPTTQATILV